ncbi:MAG: cysteine hydrolase [Chloroflexi bacterium]|nr:cysteine hydrolase [Chloroflexota bacterium]
MATGSGWPQVKAHPYVDRSFESKMLKTFGEQVDPRHTAMIMVDIQNDYCSPGGASDRRNHQVERFQRIIPPNKALLEEARRAGALPVFIQMGFEPYGFYNAGADLLMRAKKYGLESVAIKGTWGHEVVSELEPQPDEIRVTKHRSSSFQGTDLDLILRSNGVRTVVITGVVTHGCVNATFIDAVMNDYYTFVVRDCVMSPREDLHQAALTVMEAKLQENGVCQSEQVIETWQRWRAEQDAVRAKVAR